MLRSTLLITATQWRAWLSLLTDSWTSTHALSHQHNHVFIISMCFAVRVQSNPQLTHSVTCLTMLNVGLQQTGNSRSSDGQFTALQNAMPLACMWITSLLLVLNSTDTLKLQFYRVTNYTTEKQILNSRGTSYTYPCLLCQKHRMYLTFCHNPRVWP